MHRNKQQLARLRENQCAHHHVIQQHRSRPPNMKKVLYYFVMICFYNEIDSVIINRFLLFSFTEEESDEEVVVPKINDNIPRKPIIPTLTPTKNGHANPAATHRPKPASPSHHTTPIQTTTFRTTTTTNSPHNIIQAAHPQDNEIAGSVNIR